MKKIKIANKDFTFKIIHAEDEKYIDLPKYEESINEAFSIKPEDQCFFCHGRRVTKLVNNEIENKDLQIIDASLYMHEKITIHLKIYSVTTSYSMIIFPEKTKTVLDSLETLILSYNLFKKFNKDFFFDFADFTEYLQTPLHQISELYINFSKKTENIEIVFNDQIYIYKACLKITVKELIPKIKLYLNIFYDEICVLDSNSKAIDLGTRLSEIQSFSERRTIAIDIIRYSCYNKGLIKNFFCDFESCPYYKWEKSECLGFGIFDVKEIYYNTKCDCCRKIAKIKFDYIKCCKIVEKTLKLSVSTSKLESNYELYPNNYKFITLICL